MLTNLVSYAQRFPTLARLRTWFVILVSIALMWTIRTMRQDLQAAQSRIEQLETAQIKRVCVNTMNATSGLMLGGLFSWVWSLDRGVNELLDHRKDVDLAIANQSTVQSDRVDELGLDLADAKLDIDDLEVQGYQDREKVRDLQCQVNRVRQDLDAFTRAALTGEAVTSDLVNYPGYSPTSITFATNLPTGHRSWCVVGVWPRHVTDSGE